MPPEDNGVVAALSDPSQSSMGQEEILRQAAAAATSAAPVADPQAPPAEPSSQSPVDSRLAELQQQLEIYQRRDQESAALQQQREAEEVQRATERLLASWGISDSTAAEGTETSPAAPAVNAPSPTERQAIAQAVQLGMEYRQQYPTIQNERLSAVALNEAAKIVGQNGTVADLRQLAKELYELGDARLIAKAVPHMQRFRQQSAATTRAATGVDQIVTSTPQSGSAVGNFDAAEARFAMGTASEAEEKYYYEERSRRGLH